MKRTLLLLLLLICLGGFYFYTKNKPSDDTSIRIEDREFVVSDRKLIDIVTIKRPGYPQIHLSKSKDGWMLNERRKASSHVMKNILSVLTQLEIDYIPPRATLPSIMDGINKLGIEVTSYDKQGNVLSEFILGKNNNVESGTYILKKGAKQPYVVVVPAVSGGIRNYFTLTDMDLRDKRIMEINTDDIEKVTLDYKKDRINSFMIEKDGSDYKLSPLKGLAGREIKQNKNIIESYILSLKNFDAEGIMTGNPSMDSLSNHIPFAELAIDMKGGEELGYTFYTIVNSLDPDAVRRGAGDLATIERYYVFTSDGEVYTMQHRLIKDIFKPLYYFDR